MQTGIVKDVEANHKRPFSCGIRNIHRDTRIVVWAKITNGDKVWITTIEGGFDKLPIEAKTQMVEEYFSFLINKEIDYITQKDNENEENYFANIDSTSYKINYKDLREKMSDWVKDNCNTIFCKIKKNRQLGGIRAVETRKRSKIIAQIEAARIKELENEKIDNRAIAKRYSCHKCGSTFKPTVKNLVRNGHLQLHKMGKLVDKPILVGNFTIENGTIRPICHQCAIGLFIKSFPFGKAENLINYKRKKEE